MAPLEVTPVEIARYIACLGERGTVAAGILQPYLSAINRFLSDHARAPMALGPMISSSRKGLANLSTRPRPHARASAYTSPRRPGDTNISREAARDGPMGPL